jgi:hypothetical protein
MEEKQLLMQIRDALIQIDKSLDDKWKQLETWKLESEMSVESKWKQLETWKHESEMLVESKWKPFEKWMSMLTEARSDLKEIRDRIVLFVKL